MRIHFYGGIGDYLGRSIHFDLPEGAATVADLRRLLCKAYPDAAGEFASRLRACVADEIVGEAYELSEAETVEFLPPLSGG
jgi:molybdopterin converting factor small subunit